MHLRFETGVGLLSELMSYSARPPHLCGVIRLRINAYRTRLIVNGPAESDKRS